MGRSNGLTAFAAEAAAVARTAKAVEEAKANAAGWADLDALLEVVNDAVGFLDELVVNLDTDEADVAGWRSRLADAAADASDALESTYRPVRSVECAECGRHERSDVIHYDDVEAFCSTCCPACSVADVVADTPGPLELTP